MVQDGDDGDFDGDETSFKCILDGIKSNKRQRRERDFDSCSSQPLVCSTLLRGAAASLLMRSGCHLRGWSAASRFVSYRSGAHAQYNFARARAEFQQVALNSAALSRAQCLLHLVQLRNQSEARREASAREH